MRTCCLLPARPAIISQLIYTPLIVVVCLLSSACPLCVVCVCSLVCIPVCMYVYVCSICRTVLLMVQNLGSAYAPTKRPNIEFLFVPPGSHPPKMVHLIFVHFLDFMMRRKRTLRNRRTGTNTCHAFIMHAAPHYAFQLDAALLEQSLFFLFISRKNSSLLFNKTPHTYTHVPTPTNPAPRVSYLIWCSRGRSKADE